VYKKLLSHVQTISNKWMKIFDCKKLIWGRLLMAFIEHKLWCLYCTTYEGSMFSKCVRETKNPIWPYSKPFCDSVRPTFCDKTENETYWKINKWMIPRLRLFENLKGKKMGRDRESCAFSLKTETRTWRESVSMLLLF
jgi:hypothetical protein